ncbi:UNVERIFIED_CONTAM: hypothetical protein Sangu_1564200 [Sesamum angustifolium]|uniref:Zinc finger PMZ-type domain-containing protein n=1 Tax=Sesamum angustifolium TaxID=2727405 RepID=A0AAW2MQZ6_9LAMI
MRAEIAFPSWAGEDKFEVQHFMENHIVYLRDGHYSCGMFQLVGFPCCHAIASINYHRLNMEEYVDDYFKKDAYLRVYGHMINHMPKMHDYEESPLDIVEPPQVKSKPGRPKKNNSAGPSNIRNEQVDTETETQTEEISQFSNNHAFQVPHQFSQARSDKAKPENVQSVAPVESQSMSNLEVFYFNKILPLSLHIDHYHSKKKKATASSFQNIQITKDI